MLCVLLAAWLDGIDSLDVKVLRGSARRLVKSSIRKFACHSEALQASRQSCVPHALVEFRVKSEFFRPAWPSHIAMFCVTPRQK